MAKKKICVGKKFLCDNYLQCEDGKDEEDCEQQHKEKGSSQENIVTSAKACSSTSQGGTNLASSSP